MTNDQELRLYLVAAVLAWTGLAVVVALAIADVSCLL